MEPGGADTAAPEGRIRMKRGPEAAVVLGLCVLCGFSASADARITASNWTNHPRIVAVRKIANDIDAAIKNRTYKEVKKEQEYTGPYIDTMRQAFFDAKGKIRKLVTSGGSDDSSLTFTYYYDAAGGLRFVFIEGGAANGTSIQHRIYFEAGARIWEIRKLVKGPGYTFPEEWPLDELITEPATLPLDEW